MYMNRCVVRCVPLPCTQQQALLFHHSQIHLQYTRVRTKTVGSSFKKLQGWFPTRPMTRPALTRVSVSQSHTQRTHRMRALTLVTRSLKIHNQIVKNKGLFLRITHTV
jgi:hypothetical protein